jgi:hypothetical protein
MTGKRETTVQVYENQTVEGGDVVRKCAEPNDKIDEVMWLW